MALSLMIFTACVKRVSKNIYVYTYDIRGLALEFLVTCRFYYEKCVKKSPQKGWHEKWGGFGEGR